MATKSANAGEFACLSPTRHCFWIHSEKGCHFRRSEQLLDICPATCHEILLSARQFARRWSYCDIRHRSLQGLCPYLLGKCSRTSLFLAFCEGTLINVNPLQFPTLGSRYARPCRLGQAPCKIFCPNEPGRSRMRGSSHGARPCESKTDKGSP